MFKKIALCIETFKFFIKVAIIQLKEDPYTTYLDPVIMMAFYLHLRVTGENYWEDLGLTSSEVYKNIMNGTATSRDIMYFYHRSDKFAITPEEIREMTKRVD